MQIDKVLQGKIDQMCTMSPEEFEVWVDAGQDCPQDVIDLHRAVLGLKEEVDKWRNESSVTYKAAYAVIYKNIKLADIAEMKARKFRKALKKIVCLNIPMPDEVFEIANNALEEER